MRLQFIFSELRVGLRRNLTMTIAVVVTVAISLALFGAGLLIREQVNTMKGYWYDKVEVSVFLCGQLSSGTCSGAVTDSQREQLGRDLAAMPQVERVFYESQRQAYERFQEQFKESPELVKNVTPDALPESFRVKLKDATQFPVIASAFQARPGVEEVSDQRKLLDKFFRVLNGFQTAALLVALVQIVAATLLISNTIRVAAFSRRRETGIMRLVGASNLYIQLPFLLEGALAGFVGGLIAVGGVVAMKALFIDGQLRGSINSVPFIGWDAVLGLVPVLLISGAAISGLASFVSLRRYLRV